MIRRLSDLPLLLLLIGISAVAMLLPAAHALAVRDHAVARAFFYSAVVLLVLVALVAIAVQNRPRGSVMRDQLGGLVGGFAVLPLAMAIPVAEAVRDTTFFNAWFEMVSSLTTTGASVLESRGSGSLHLWRATVGWLGGAFMLVASVAILEPLRLGGFEMLEGDASTPMIRRPPITTRVADPSERIIRYGAMILPVYALLTIVLAIGLIMAGDEALVAVCHAMATLSTSGISPVGGLSGSTAGMIGEVMIFLMLIAGMTRRSFPTDPQPGQFRRWLSDRELHLGLAIVGVVTAFLFLRHWIGAVGVDLAGDLRLALSTLWGAAFTSLSFLTTNGFVSAHWATVQQWSGAGSPGVILVGLAIFGGGIATTTGGVKLLRVLVLATHTLREVERLVHPSSVGSARTMPRQQRRSGAFLAWIFFMVFASSLSAVVAALSLTGLDFDAAIAMAVAALTTTGQIATYGMEDAVSYAALDPVAKIVLMLAMVVGRLETLAVIALIHPEYWRK